MTLEEVIEKTGGFGAFQRRVCLVFLFGIPWAWQAIASVFLLASTDHWCSVSNVPEVNCTELSLTRDAQCTELKKNLTIPYELKDSKLVYEQCVQYEDSFSRYSSEDSYLLWRNNSGLKIKECGPTRWDYDHSQYVSTVVQEFDLVCDQKNLPNYAQSVFFAGILCGSIFFGMLSDWIGRYPTFFICAGCEAVFGTIAAFSPNFATFTAMRFFVGMTGLGGYMTAFVLGTEFVGAEYRAMAGTVIACFFSVGYMILAVIAYFIRDWRNLQLVISAPIILFALLIPFISESVRWLLSNGEHEKAEKILRKAAKVNKVTLPDVLFNEEDIAKDKKLKAGFGRRTTFIDLFRTPNMRLKTINILYNWFVNNLVYYGLSMSTSGLGVDSYVAAFVSGAVEFPAYLSCWFIMQRYGRRWPLCLYMVIGGVACILTILIPPGVGRTVVAMIGKFCISASFGLIYIFSAEIYPTVVRSIGIGMSSMSARISGILSPIILLLGNYWAPLPLLVFGISSILAGVFALLLPETKGRPLPETLEDGENIGASGFFTCQHKPEEDGYQTAPTNEKTATKEEECKV